MTQQIVIREIIPPSPGKKQYQLIDTSGQRWGVFPDHIQDYQVNGVYKVIEADSRPFNGKIFTTLKSAEFIGMESGEIPLPSNRPVQHAAPAPQRSYPQRSAAPRSFSRPSVSGGGDTARDRHIFVCGALNNILSNPNTHPAELNTQKLTSMIRMLMEAYRYSLGGETTLKDDMDDEIPDLTNGRG